MQAGCTTFYSEELQHGFTVAKLTIINPCLARSESWRDEQKFTRPGR
jgi:hypothetical protein